jgi:hypothetical protein
MITDKIKALFQLIEFLHSNIVNFKKHDKLINELYLLGEIKSSLKPRNKFTDKLQYDEVQAEIKDKFKVIQENIIQPIQAKTTELNICDWNNPETLLNYNISEIISLQKNFNKKDIQEIVHHKSKYLDFRTQTNCTYFQDLFFSGLDEILKELFGFFTENETNEFEAFETKPIEGNSIAEIISNDCKLNIEIDKNLSITEKLNYWQNIIKTNISEPLKKKYGNDFSYNYDSGKEQRKILFKLFGPKCNLVSPLLIPEQIYNEHFENGLNEPEFTYWFLQYNARIYFDVELKMKRLPEKLNTPLSENFIKAELKKLNDFEQKAEILLYESKLDIYNDYFYSEYAKEIEYLRIKAEYYKTHTLPSAQAIGNTTVVLYAEHIYLKEFLENEVIKSFPPQQTETQKPKLRINQIALKYVYEGFQITRKNCNEIAKQYGHNSGEKLFQKFTYYSSTANRKGKPTLCTPKKIENKIRLFESVIELLPNDKRNRANDEVLILRKIRETEYQ